MRPHWIAYVTGALPIAGILIAYCLSVAVGDVPGCIPNLGGCTSVSSTGRHFPGELVFKAAMLATVPLTILFWVLAHGWVRLLSASAGKSHALIVIFGVVAAISVVLYVSFLGTHGETYQFLRRFGVSVYFGFTYLAQAFITRALWNLRDTGMTAPLRCLFALLLIQLAIGLASVFADLFQVDTDAVENILEWNFALAMMGFFIVCGWAWQRSGFELKPRVGWFA